MSRIAITTEEMKTLVSKAMDWCFEKHPEKYVRNFNLRCDWTFGRINGRTLLRILQDEYEWPGEIPLVRQMAHGEQILVETERAIERYKHLSH